MNRCSQLLAVLLTLAFVGTAPAEGDPGTKELPVAISFRKSTVNDSLVARFTNTSTDVFLTAVITFKNNTYNETKQRKLNVGPGKTVEVGWAQGWRVMSGETITIESKNYTPLTAKVP